MPPLPYQSNLKTPGSEDVFAIIGIVLVFGAVIGGFLMEKGHLAVLVQPAEVLIIAGPRWARC
jgi:flagellar motor component MotA